jgi:hypothetical protein
MLKKELNSLDLVEAITKSTSQLCLSDNDFIENTNSTNLNHHEGFYEDISRELSEISQLISQELS